MLNHPERGFRRGRKPCPGIRGKSLDSGSKYSILCAIYNLHLTPIRSSRWDSVRRPRRKVPVAALEELSTTEDLFSLEAQDP